MAAHNEWIAECVGTTEWVVAPRMTAGLRAKGYKVAISPKRFDEIQADYERATGEEARRIAFNYSVKYGVSLVSMLT